MLLVYFESGPLFQNRASMMNPLLCFHSSTKHSALEISTSPTSLDQILSTMVLDWQMTALMRPLRMYYKMYSSIL